MSEHSEQCALIDWFRLQYPRYRRCFFAIPNGAVLCDLTPEKRAMRMGYLQAEGFKRGVSDLLLAVPRGGYCGLWLEMKRTGGTVNDLSAEQFEHLLLMRRMGYAAHWSPGFDHAVGVINGYLRREKTQVVNGYHAATTSEAL